MGRPREFNVEKALDQALEVFWRNGYEGASIADLTEAMGINPPSLYAAFGNKEKLFKRALDRYVERNNYWDTALAESTARGMVEHLLRASANFLGDPNNPRGCLMVRSTLLCSEDADAIRGELAERAAQGEALIRRRLEEAKTAGELPVGLEPADFARYLLTVLEGMSVQSANGATRDELMRTAETALRVWPVG